MPLKAMQYNCRFIVLILLLWRLFSCEAVSAPLRAGVAVADITPPAGTELAGFKVRRLAEKVHDRLYARVLVLKSPETSVALIVCDLHRLQSPALVERLGRELGIEHPILIASHSYATPSLDAESWNSPWAKVLENQILQTARRAAENLFSAKILVGQGALIGAHNIRVYEDDGSVNERWSNPAEEGTAPVDPGVRVVRIDQEGGGTRGLLVHYSCEPTILGSDNREISAEFPGAMARQVETELEGHPICFFLGGASANIYPFRAHLAGPEGFKEIERMGARLGREVLRVGRNLKPGDLENQLTVSKNVLTFRNRWQSANSLQIGVTTILINKSLAFLAAPATMFLEFQLMMNARSPVPTFLVNNAYSGGGSWAGIVPTIVQAAEGGFGASYATEIEVGAGEAMIDLGIIQLYRFLGKLDDLPRGVLVNDIPDLVSP